MKACFVIHGEFVTQQARTFWSEDDDPERALNLLNCVHGLSYEQHLDILEGRAKLVGSSSTGIKLQPDNQKLPTLAEVLGRMRKERDEARGDTADLLQIINKDTVVVASPTGRRLIPRRQAEIKPGSSTVGTLRKGLGWKGTDSENPEPRFYQCVDEAAYGRSFDDVLRPLPGIGRVAAEVQEEDHRKAEAAKPLPRDTITETTGWLSPEGKFYPCRYSQHNQTAWDLDMEPGHLDDVGWIRLQKRNEEEQNIFKKDYDAKVPDAQKALLVAFCTSQKIELPWWLERSQ